MGAPALVPVGSRWSANNCPSRVFVVLERKPFGRICTQEEGRAYFGEIQQKQLLASFTRIGAPNDPR